MLAGLAMSESPLSGTRRERLQVVSSSEASSPPSPGFFVLRQLQIALVAKDSAKVFHHALRH